MFAKRKVAREEQPADTMQPPFQEFVIRMRPIPMQEPEIKALSLCPVCFHKHRQTAEVCAHCGVERHFGPTRREALVSTLIGFAAGPFLATLILGTSYWAIPLSAVGGLLGFFICQIRHSGDRWMKEK